MRFPTPSEWLKLVDEFRTGKMTLKEFVLEHDVSFNTAQYWIYRKSKQLRSESVSETKFLPVTVVASPALKARGQQLDNGLIEVVRHGLVLRFAVGTDTRYVAELPLRRQRRGGEQTRRSLLAGRNLRSEQGQSD